MKRKLNPILAAPMERLERNLKNLSFYCNPGFKLDGGVASFVPSVLRGIPGTYELGYWPSYELLQEIEDDVIVLAERGRVRQIFPRWKAFEQLDRRLTKLRLKLRVGNLISRAHAMLPSESELNKLVTLAIAGNIQARCSLGDMVMKTEKLAEVLQADRQMERQRYMAHPVARWTVWLRHPMAKDFVCIAGGDLPGQDWRDSHRRILQWDRVRRHRSAKKTSLKSVTPI
jgi:hypothetical protein